MKHERIKGPRRFRRCMSKRCGVVFYGQHELCKRCRRWALEVVDPKRGKS